MDRKDRIVRFWLLAAAMLAVVVVWPEVGVGLWPVAFFFPTCVCCGTPTCATACSDRPDQMQVTIVGVVDATCTDCDENYNITYFVSFDNGLSTFTGACAYAEAGGIVACTSVFSANVRIHDNGSTVRLVSGVSLAPTGGGAATDTALYENTDIGEGAPPIDCTTIAGKALALTSATNSKCNWSGSSVTAGAV